MKDTLKKTLAAFVMVMTMVAGAAEYKLRLEQVGYTVPAAEGYKTAVVKVYATFGADVQACKLTFGCAGAAGFTPDISNCNFNSAVLVAGTPIKNADATKAVLTLQGQQGIASINATTEEEGEIELATVTFSVSEAALAANKQPLTLTVGNVKAKDGTNMTAVIGSATGIDITIYKNFTFAEKSGAKFKTDEDTDFRLNVKDEAFSSYFTSSKWGGTEPVSTNEVTFSDLTIAAAAGNVQGLPAAALEDEGKTIAIKPAVNTYGAYTISFKATLDGTTDVAEITDFPVAISPVNHVPEVAFITKTLSGKEGESFSFEVSYADDATDFENAVKKVMVGEMAIEGNWISADTEGQYLFTSTEAISAEAVVHPARTASGVVTLAVTDAGKAGEEAENTSIEKEATVEDVDQPVSAINGSISLSASSAKVTESVTATASGATDADKDAISYAYSWKKGEAEIGNEAALDIAAAGLKKGDTVTVNAIAWTEPYADGQKVNAAFGDEKAKTLTIVNSAPVNGTEAGTLFVLRDGTNKKSMADFVFNVTDADGWEDIVVNGGNTTMAGTNGTLSIAVAEGADGTTAVVSASYELTNVLAEDALPVDTFTVTVADKDGIAAQSVTITVNYQANPPPVVTIEVDEDTIDEMADGVAGSFTVTATASDDTVYPAGVSAWDIEVPAGWTAELVDTPATGSVTEGIWTGTAQWKVTCAGYNTIVNGADGIRDASKNFTFTVKAQDTATNAWGEASAEETVNDTDQLPTAATLVTLTPDAPVFGDTITVEAAGATDADGDEFTYEYAWAYKAVGADEFTELSGETGNTLTNATAIVKGQVVKAIATAVTHPYGGESTVKSASLENTVAIANTKPYIENVGGTGKTDIDTPVEYTLTISEYADPAQAVAPGTVQVVGADNDAADKLTYAIDAAGFDTEAGTLAVDADGLVTFTPAPYFNTVDYDKNPLTFKVNVNDGDDDGTNVAIITVVVTEVNNAPVLNMADQYVLPDERGERKITAGITCTPGIPANEKGQTVTVDSQKLEVVEDPDKIFDGFGFTSVAADGTVHINYTIKADAPMGSSCKVKVVVTDNGTTKGAADVKTAEGVFTIYVGASPWYPIISFTCTGAEDEHAGHTVVLKGSDETEYAITLMGAVTQVMPGDYAKAGIPGYADDTTVSVKVYVWDYVEGTTETECATVADQAINAYGLPGTATVTTGDTEITADENGWFTLPDFNVPMAKSYTLAIYDAEQQLVKSIGPVDFGSNEKGIILPGVTGLKLQLTDAGVYAVKVFGANPNGDGIEAQIASVTVNAATDEKLEWPVDGKFTPVNDTLTSTSVKFSWPVVSAAIDYELRVYDANGKMVVEQMTATNDLTCELPDGDAAAYTWNVLASSGKDTISSGLMSFTVTSTMADGVVVNGVAVLGENTIQVNAAISADKLGHQVTVEWEYFSMADCVWVNGATEDITLQKTMSVTLEDVPVDAGDFVFVRIVEDGKALTDWTAYELQ